MPVMLNLQRAIRYSFSHGTPWRSGCVALVVGTILNLINQGDAIFEVMPINWTKIFLTYLVPYAVGGLLRILLLRICALSIGPTRLNKVQCVGDQFLDGAEHGRRMHLPAGPISSDRNAVNCSCLPLPLVPTRDRDRACAQRSL